MSAMTGTPLEQSPREDCADADQALLSARSSIHLEAEGLAALARALDGDLGTKFCAALALIRAARGRVIVTGMGKSGHVGRKVAATLASTGTPAFFVHPAEASHGDLGMITADDVILALSWSGETIELRDMLQHARRFKVPLIAITSSGRSALGRNADVALVLPKPKEACPHNLAPTTSTTMQLVVGDAIAIALLESRGFTASDFRVFHPGGKLGAGLTYVRDLMHEGNSMPLVGSGSHMAEAILCMSEKGFGCVGVVDPEGRLCGVVTDGDLRRHMSSDLMAMPIEDVMTDHPRTVAPDMIASAALEIMTSSKITALFVVEGNRPLGVVHLHDVLRIGVA